MTPADAPCSIENVRQMLSARFETIDYAQAKQDAEPFIQDFRMLDVWSVDFFKQITENLKEN